MKLVWIYLYVIENLSEHDYVGFDQAYCGFIFLFLKAAISIRAQLVNDNGAPSVCFSVLHLPLRRWHQLDQNMDEEVVLARIVFV